MKRASTVKKVSIADCQNIQRFCEREDGVIVRYRGVEYAVFCCFALDGVWYFGTMEGVTLLAKDCTIRKGLPDAKLVRLAEIVRFWEPTHRADIVGDKVRVAYPMSRGFVNGQIEYDYWGIEFAADYAELTYVYGF